MHEQAKVDSGDDWRSEVGEVSSGALSDDLVRAREPGRGREASAPQDIPALGVERYPLARVLVVLRRPRFVHRGRRRVFRIG